MSAETFDVIEVAREVIAQSVTLCSLRNERSLLDTVDELVAEHRLSILNDQIAEQWGGW